jgi:hypothetical protein
MNNNSYREFLARTERGTRPSAADGPLTAEIKGTLRKALPPELCVELAERDGIELADHEGPPD